MKKLNLSELKKCSPIVARGEVADHAHIVCGNAKVYKTEEELEYEGDILPVRTTIIDVLGEAKIRHLLEKAFTETETEVWTEEHKDIPLKKGTYIYVPQIEQDPYNDAIRKVLD